MMIKGDEKQRNYRMKHKKRGIREEEIKIARRNNCDE